MSRNRIYCFRFAKNGANTVGSDKCIKTNGYSWLSLGELAGHSGGREKEIKVTVVEVRENVALDEPFKDEAQTALFKDFSPYRAVNTFYFGYKNQSVYVIWGRSSCLF